MKKIDVYDFDKTLYKKDSSVQFFLFCLRKRKKNIKYIPGILMMYLLFYLKLIEKEKLKEYFFKFLSDFDSTDKLVEEFWSKEKKNIRLELLKNSYNEKVVVSASPEFLLKGICKEIGINKVIASKVDIKTGKFLSLNCHGEEKVNRINEEYKNYKIDKFYSDSKSDKYLADISKNAFLVDKNGFLKRWN